MSRAALALALSLLAGAASAKPLTVGFYLPWDEASRASVIQHAASLDVLAPMSGALDSPTGSVRWQPDVAQAPALAAAHGKAKVFPIVSNAHDTVWDAAAADGALLKPAAGDAFIAALVAQAKAHDYGGYILDFETLSPAATPAYAPFLARLHAALKPLGRELWVTTTLGADPALIKQLEAATDAVVLMAYDQCWATGTPGPIAGQDWLEANLDARLGHADPSHYIVALGAYGYDWRAGEPAEVISAPDAVRYAKGWKQPIARQRPDANPHYAFESPDGEGHTTWYLDAATFQAGRAAALARHARGVAIWRLGLEDPAIWGKAVAAPTIAAPRPPRSPCVALRH
jgi:spore germination protein YaaH